MWFGGLVKRGRSAAVHLSRRVTRPQSECWKVNIKALNKKKARYGSWRAARAHWRRARQTSTAPNLKSERAAVAAAPAFLIGRKRLSAPEPQRTRRNPNSATPCINLPVICHKLLKSEFLVASKSVSDEHKKKKPKPWIWSETDEKRPKCGKQAARDVFFNLLFWTELDQVQWQNVSTTLSISQEAIFNILWMRITRYF